MGARILFEALDLEMWGVGTFPMRDVLHSSSKSGCLVASASALRSQPRVYASQSPVSRAENTVGRSK